MAQRIHRIVLLVKDQDEAIDFFVRKLGFQLTEDTLVTPSKRWVVVTPPGDSACGILLALSGNQDQLDRTGNQTGGKVLLVMHTDDFDKDMERLKFHGIEIVRGPVTEPWGKVVVFRDLYGNLWDLVEPVAEK